MLVMETKFYIKNRENRMETIFKKVTKWVALFLCVFLGSSGAFAQTLTVDGVESTTACPNNPIVLQATGFDSNVTTVDFYRSIDGTNFGIVGSATGADGVFVHVDDMSNTNYSYYAKAGGKQSNVVTVNQAPENECASSCYTTTTGEYYLGTDFNPKPGNEDKFSFDLNKVENHFQDNGITFVGSSSGMVQKWDKVTDMDSIKGVVGDNYYYVYNVSNGSSTPFKLTFDRAKYYGKTFRFSMRLYLNLENCTSFESQAKMNFRTQFGNAVRLCVDASIYDGKKGTHLKTYPETCGNGHLDNNLVLGSDVNTFLANGNKLLRMEFVFYGEFRTQNQESLEIYPEFQQWSNCAEVAVDYISGEAQMVCMDNSAVCIGDNVLVHAAGFPRNAQYVWQKWSGTDWVTFNDKNVDEIQIKVENLGKDKYRVKDSNTNTVVEFFVTGKNCKPILPGKIVGERTICFDPTNTSALGEKFYVEPRDGNPNVSYTWKLTKGDKDISNRISYKGGELVHGDPKGDTIYVKLGNEDYSGEYTLQVYTNYWEKLPDNTYKKETASTPIPATLNAYRMPKIDLVLHNGSDGVDENQKKLCPTDKKQVLTIKADGEMEDLPYIYEWSSATPFTGHPDSANVIMPWDSACSGKLKEHKLGVTVSIQDVGCPTTAERTYGVSPLEQPEIHCNTLPQSESFFLSETESEKSIQLKSPTFEAGCEKDPDFFVSVKEKKGGVCGKEVASIATSKSEVENALKNNPVNLSAGSYCVEYVVRDGCGNEATCAVEILVKDTTPPNINCVEIDSFATTTTEQGACEATPGSKVELPGLAAPTLKDQNGVDGEILGVYEGRLVSANVPDPNNEDTRALFDRGVNLNAPYEIGSTYILWSFTDDWGNTSYCTQLVEVIDDTKPNVTCHYNVNAPQVVASFDSICGLSVNGLLGQVESPSAVDVCSGAGTALSPVIFISGENGGALDSYRRIEKDEFDDLIFKVNQTYRIVWRYYKAYNTSVYEDCILQFEVKDKTAPVFDCTQLTTIYALANTYKELNKLPEYLDFASYDDVKKDGNTYEGTLKNPFDEGLIKFVTSSDVKDNCDNNVTVEVRVYDPSGAVFASNVGVGTKLNGIEDLKKLQFKVGANLINYTIKDASGNELQCGQSVVVSTGTTPEPDCPAEFVTIYADSNCEAEFVLAKADVPTANVPVLSRGLYFVFPSNVLTKEADLHKYFPSNDGVYKDNIGLLSDKSPYYLKEGKTHPAPEKEYVKLPALNMGLLCQATSFDNWDLYNNGRAYQDKVAGPGVGMFPPFGPGPAAKEKEDVGRLIYWSPWRTGAATDDKMIGVSNSMSLTDNYTVYPYKIELLTSDGQPVLAETLIAQDSLYGTEDGTFVHNDIETVRYRYFRPRSYYPYNLNGDKNAAGYISTEEFDYVCEAKSLNRVNNYEETILSTKLTKGEYQLIYHFENQRNKLADDYQSVACTVKIVVEDTIPPTMDCSVIDLAVTKKTFAANDQCKVSMDSLRKYGFKEFTKDELNVNDNCSNRENITLELERVHNSLVNKEPSIVYGNELEMGLTTFRWIITDESSNKDTCELNITVVDLTPPVVDCSKIPNISAVTEPGLCTASSASFGLTIPVAEKGDACSNFSDSEVIKGVPYRYRLDENGDTINGSNGLDVFDVPYELGDTYIRWTFTDAVGNDTFCIQKITVIDNQKPIFADCDNLEKLTYELEAEECAAPVDKVKVLLGSHTATDNCGVEVEGVPYVHVTIGDPIKPEYKDFSYPLFVPLPDNFLKDTTYKIIWVFDDGEGNAVACDQDLEIKDVTIPDISSVCPSDKVIDVAATVECSVEIGNIDLPTIDEMKIDDKCDGILYPEMIIRIVDSKGKYLAYRKNVVEGVDETVGVLFPVTKPGMPHYVIYAYEDKAGNVDTCQFEVNIADSIAPIVECMAKEQGPFFRDDEECYMSWERLFEMYHRPSARDLCDGELYGQDYITPTINRFEIKCSEYVGGVCAKYDTTLVGHTDEEFDYPIGETLLEYIFTDKTGNSDTCLVSIPVQTGIECPNDTLKPKAELGECIVKFGTLASMLDTLKSYAVDICTGDSILGNWTGRNGGMVPSYDFEFEVGDTLTNIIQLQIPLVGSEYYCDVVIIPSHQNPIKPACEIEPLSDFVVTAIEGECEASNESTANVPVPTAIDTCTKATIYGVPFIYGEDTTKVDFSTKIFPTGTTTIHWQFVSPWNLSDTAWCEQNIIVKGNKKFDIDCDVVAPTYHDTILDCGPADPANLSIKTPWVADPCLTESDTAYKRMGVGVRSDSLAMTDPFPLGNTQIKWTFTDFTGAVDTFCIQDIEIRSREEMIVNCDAIEDVKVDVAEGECTVPSDKVQLPTPQYALHPCLKDESGNPLKIEGVPSRGDKKELDEPYYVGRTLIIWTFTDTTNTLAKPVDTCHSYVQVGDVNEMPVDCENFPDTLIVLPDDKCELSWADFNFEVKPVVDLCTREIIDPVVSVTGLSEVVEYLEYKTYFVLESGEEVDVLEPTQVAKDTIVKLLNDITFNLGASTITWEYNFKGTIFSCNQTISVKNKVAPSGGCESVPDELTIVAPSGECEIPTDALVDSLLKMLEPWPVAYDHCDVDKANPIKGKIYFEGKEISSDGSFSLPVGKNTVQWVFIDTAINTVGDTCDKTLIIQSDMAPIFDCQSLDTLNFETDKCEYTYEWNDENIPQAKDACTSEFFAGVGTRSDNEDLNAPYPIGKTVITWKFKSPYSTDSTICEQVVWVRTTTQPLFDCESLDTVQLFVLDGMCDEDVFTYLDTLTYPVAKDSCTGIEIPGIPLTKDSVEFSSESRFYVGDTTKIIWKFFHDSLNVTPKYCDQYVLVTSYNEPIFDCEALQEQDIKFEIADCDTILGSDAIPTPAAVDYCTKDSVYGVGSRSDGKELNDPFPVGTTTITWLFKSPYSNISAECDQKVVVLSTQEIDFDCEDLDSIYVPIYDVNTCDTSGLILNAPVALHPCPEQSGVAEIKGVPFINKAVTITPNADSTEWTIDKIHVGLHKITWTFTDPSDPATLLDPVKECEQVLQIGDGTNASVDCKNYPDTTIVLDPADCAISWEDMNLNIKPVFDVCSGELLVPTLSRSTGKAIEATLNADGTLKIVADEFAVGPDTITWYFEQIGASCEQAILVLDGVAPIFDCDDLDTLKLVTESGLCEASNEDLLLLLGEHAAVDSCTQIEIPGVPTLMDGSELPSTVKVGDTIRVLWTFKNDTLNAVAKECEQVVLVIGSNAPQFDCESLADTVLYLSMDECVLSSSSLELNIPIAKDSCTGTDVPGVASGLLTEYPVGTTQITWSFVSPYSTEPKECPQNIVVKDTIAPEAPCEDLTDTIKVRITSTVADILSVTLQEVKDAGLITPSMEDPCDGDIIATGEVANGTKLEEVSDFELGEHKIFWIFADKSGNTDTCSQIVLVEDWVLDTLYCPSNLESKVYSCVEDVPAPYETFEEFKDAGGSFTNEAKIKEGSFGYRSEIEGDSCEMTFHRIYFVVDVRGNEISCEQLYTVKDDVAPTLEGDITDMRIACTDEIPAVSDVVVADNCDPNPVVKMTETDNRSDDPSDCNYYNYEITRIWEVSDRCGNVNSYTQLISVIDSIAPTFTFPDNWKDTVLSNYLKGCLFGVPDFSEEVRSMISDNCQEINNLIIKQTPSANDTIRETTRVWVKVFDLCGNVDSISKVVYVQKQAEILSLEAYDITKCGSDSSVIDLWGQTTRFATGFRYQVYGDAWYSVPSNPVYDCYRDSISEESLVFSDNPLTYYDKFHPGPLDADKEIQRSLTELKRMSRSGKYIFVAVDTATMCKDTATSYLTINERPRVAIESGIMTICELTTVDSLDLYSYVKCVDDMGSEISNEGWTLGEDVYSFVDSVIMANNEDNLIYFVENACGKTTSEDTYITFCDSIPSTTEDSLKWVGGSEKNLAMLRSEDYKTKDSILLDVRKRFESEAIVINSTPNDPARIWKGEQVVLELNTDYKFDECLWYKVRGYFDYSSEVLKDSLEDEMDELLDIMEYSDLYELFENPEDTSVYYVTLTDGVCPAIPGQLLQVDVLPKLPTAFTPYDKDGMNDVYMEGRAVVIFDRYGAKVFEGDNGWDGTFKGRLADPGVYYSKVFLNSGMSLSGTIEIVKVK